jgi:hypothetical protein
LEELVHVEAAEARCPLHPHFRQPSSHWGCCTLLQRILQVENMFKSHLETKFFRLDMNLEGLMPRVFELVPGSTTHQN